MTPDVTDASVTQWLDRLKSGDPAAAGPLRDRYFRQMKVVARERLRGRPAAGGDEEDVALSAFHNFCRAAETGQFLKLADRGDLWPILSTLIENKAIDLIRRAQAHKRGGRAARVEADLDQFFGASPEPDLAAEFADECERWLAVLGDPALRAVAVLRLDGLSVDEIAARLDRTPRTVERRLHLIRRVWSEVASRERPT